MSDDDTFHIHNAHGAVRTLRARPERTAPGGHEYCPLAVDLAIASSNRSGRRISRGEARVIHALLRGRR